MTTSSLSNPAPSRLRLRSLLAGCLVIAAGLRLAHWWRVREAPFVGSPVMDSQEYHRWALELAGGDWLGSHAFFQAPLYPYLMGVLYAFVAPRPDAVYLFQIAVALVAIYALYRAGLELGGPTLGLAGAGLAAATGVLVFHDAQLLKESLATSMVAFLLWALLRLRRQPRAAGWLGAGLILGILAGLRENALLLLPFLLVLPWMTFGPEQRRSRPLLASLLLVSGVLLALAPWAVRNQLVAGELLLTSYQGGVNFYIGNHPGADGTYRPLVPGKQVPALERQEPVRLAEAALGRPLSASEVSRFWWRQSFRWAAAEPLSFARLQVRKLGLFWRFYEQPDAVDYYWMRERSPALRFAFVEFGSLALLAAAGLWLVRRNLAAWAPVLLVLGGWVAATVAFFVFSRYRLPVIPALALLAAVPVAQVLAPARWRRAPIAAAAGAAVLLLAFFIPHFLGHAPRLDLVHFNLGRLAEEEGRPAEAKRHYLTSLEENPSQLLPLMNLGTLAARRGEPDRAVGWYELALATEPASDDLWANLGAAHLGRGAPEEARAALAQALALNPTHLPAMHSMALVAELQGRLEEARRWNRQVLAREPSHGPALRQAQRLEP